MQHPAHPVRPRIVVHEIDVVPPPADLHDVPRVAHVAARHDRALHADLAHHAHIQERIRLADARAGLEKGIGVVDRFRLVVGVGADEEVVDVERLFGVAELSRHGGDDAGDLLLVEGRRRLPLVPGHRVLEGHVDDDVRKQAVRRVIRDAGREEKELRRVREEVGVDPHEIFHRDAVAVEVERFRAHVDGVRHAAVDLVVGRDRLPVFGHDVGRILRVRRPDERKRHRRGAEEGEPSFGHHLRSFLPFFTGDPRRTPCEMRHFYNFREYLNEISGRNRE